MELLTYTEASEITGLTNKTLQRHVKRGILVAVETPVGKRIPREALTPYLGLQRDSEGQDEGTPEKDTQESTGVPMEDRRDQGKTPDPARGDAPRTAEDWRGQESPSVPLAAHLSALDLARAQLEYLQRQAEEAQHQALVAERAKMALELQLGQYQRVLAEQAESLAEERARRKHLETSIKETTLPEVLNVSDLKIDIQTPKRGFRQRLSRWLFGEKTG